MSSLTVRGVPWWCNLGNMQMEGRGGGGPQGGKEKGARGGARVYNGQGALEEQRLTGESEKVGP